MLALLVGCADIHVHLLDTADPIGMRDSADTAAGPADTDSADTAAPARVWSVRPAERLLNLPTASSAALLLGDLDADGLPDLVHLSQGSSGLYRLTRWRAAAGGPVADTTVEAAGVLEQARLGDLDGDGTPELLAAGSGAVVRAPLPDGELGAIETLATLRNGVQALQVGDLTGDGVDELAAAEWGATPLDLRVFTTHGGGALRALGPIPVDLPSLSGAFVIGERGPGRLVLAEGRVDPGPTLVLDVDPDASPAMRVATLGVLRTDGFTLSGLVELDLDDDGVAEVITTSAGGLQAWSPTDGGVQVLRSAPDSSDAAYALGAADLEGDGDLDLVELRALTEITDHSTSVTVGLSVAVRTPSGLELGEPVQFATGPAFSSGPGTVVLADLDRDACVDVAFLDVNHEPWLATGKCDPG